MNRILAAFETVVCIALTAFAGFYWIDATFLSEQDYPRGYNFLCLAALFLFGDRAFKAD